MNHGIYTEQVPTSLSAPVIADSGIIFAVGAAPVHTVDGTVNEPIMCYSYAEAVTAMGYSDDWVKYPLCEVIYTAFQLYGVAPIVLVNVLDPEQHKKSVKATEYALTEGQAFLPLEAVLDTVEVTGYVLGDDYDLFYDGESLVLEVTGSGAIAEAESLEVSYTAVDPTAVEMTDIVGGFDTKTKKNLGFELVDSVFAKYGIIVDLLIAPGWSHHSEVAAIMGAKAESISGFFEGRALVDVDDKEVTHYGDVPAWKKAKNLFSKYQIVCYPTVKLGDRTFRFSTQLAGLMSKTDAGNGCPYESPSNKTLMIDTCVVGETEEALFLGVSEANYLNDQGICTAINHIGGYVAWGNMTACYPSNTDTKDFFIPVGRMFAWVASTLILTYWGKVDKPMTRRLIDNIIDSTNIWLNGLQAEEKILGGRVEFREDENTDVALMAGQMTFHVYLTPPSPAQEIRFKMEYDVAYLKAALMA